MVRPVSSRIARLATALTFAAALAAGCSASPGGSKAATGPESSVTTGFDTKTPVTLNVLDLNPGDAAIDQLNAEFEKRYPNVTVKRTTKNYGDYYATLKLALSSPNAPDVAQGGQGWTSDGTLVKAGLIVPVDNYAKAYGWDGRGYGAMNELRLNSTGSIWGAGRLWGLAHYAAPVGFFYHADQLRKLGLAVPKTMDEFEHALAVAKAAGDIPIAFGDLDKWPGEQEYAMLQNAVSPPADINSWIYGRAGATIGSATDVQAAATLQAWAKHGYFTPGFNGISYDDSVANFAKGQGVFMYTGTWNVGEFQKDANIGFFLLPPKSGGAPVAIGSLGEPWHIVASSKHKDVAAAYIDWLTGPHAEQVFMKVDGQIPAMPIPATGGSPLFKSAVGSWQALTEGGGLVNYLGWATPTMDQTLGGAIQELMAGRKSPQDTLAAAQKDWSDFQQKRRSGG